MFCLDWCGGGGGGSSSWKTDGTTGYDNDDGYDGGSNNQKKKKKTTSAKNNTNNSNGNDGRRSMFGTIKDHRFNEIYTLGSKLGQGNFAIVKQATRKKKNKQQNNGTTTTQYYAIKIVDRTKLSTIDEEALRDEIRIQKLLSSPSQAEEQEQQQSKQKHINNIVQLYETFEEPSKYYLVLEMVNGGELFDRIVSKEYYSEKEARDCLKIVLDAMKYCHINKVAHRDLKPENLLLKSKDNDTDIKIADFGFAKIVNKPNTLSTQCGTPAFVAPEILLGIKYDERCDNWSLGVIAYILLGGYPPFRENDIRKLFKIIMKGKFEFHEKYWCDVSPDAKEFISSLMEVDYKKRSTSSVALQNEWICYNDDIKMSKRNLDLGKLRQFNAKRKFRGAVDSVIAINRLKNLAEYL